MPYNRDQAVAYAHQWAYGRNPRYYDFENLGGDCTNFISQCLFNGCHVMNDTKDVGWYYHSLNNRSAGWSSAAYLHKFLVNNKGPGPYGHEAPLIHAQPGDVIHISFDGVSYTHSLLIVAAGTVPDPANILIATHSFDSDNRKLNTYHYQKAQLVVIDGARGYR